MVICFLTSVVVIDSESRFLGAFSVGLLGGLNLSVFLRAWRHCQARTTLHSCPKGFSFSMVHWESFLGTEHLLWGHFVVINSSPCHPAPIPPLSRFETIHLLAPLWRNWLFLLYVCTEEVAPWHPSISGGWVLEESACQCRRCRRCGFNPWVGRFPEGGSGNPLQYSCRGNPVNRGAWLATVRGVAESDVAEWLSTHCVDTGPGALSSALLENL